MSRTNRFLSGIGFGYASQILTTLIAFWLTPFLLHRIGQTDFGLWLVGTQVMFYFGLMDLGVVALLPRETAFATGKVRDLEKASDLPELIGQTMRLVLWQLPLVSMGALIFWFLLPSEWTALRYPIAVVLLAFVLTFPLRIFGAVLHGLQDHAFLGRSGIYVYLLGTLATVLLVLAGWGLYALAIGWTVQQFSSAAIGWNRLHRHYPGVLPRKLPGLGWSIVRKRFGQGSWVSLNQIAQVLLNGTDVLIVGKLFGPAAVVPFVITGKLIGVLSNQPQMLMAAAGPALSQMKMGESRERLSEVCIALSQAMLLLSGAVVCVVLVVNQGFIGSWVGPGEYGGFWLTALILASMLLHHWNRTIGYALFCFGYERRLCLTTLVDGVVSVGAVALFAALFGLIGAPIGMILGACLISLPLNLVALARESNVSIWALLQPLFAWFIRFVALAFAAGVVARSWTPTTFPLLVVATTVSGIIYLAVMFPLTLRSPLGLYVRPRIFPLGSRMMRALRPGTSN